MEKKKDDLDVKIKSKRGALLERARENCENSILQGEVDGELHKAVLERLKGMIADEEKELNS